MQNFFILKSLFNNYQTFNLHAYMQKLCFPVCSRDSPTFSLDKSPIFLKNAKY